MKKIKIYIVVSVVGLLAAVESYIAFPLIAATVCIVGVIAAGSLWIADLDIEPIGNVTILLFPGLVVGSIVIACSIYIPLFIHIILGHEQWWIGFLVALCEGVGIGIISYILVGAMNIMNASRYKRLPLLQAAQTIVYVSSFITSYICVELVEHSASNDITLVLVCLPIMGYLFFINTWSIRMPLTDSILFSGLGIFVIAEVMGTLLFFPLFRFLFAPSLTCILYIFTGLILHIYKRGPLTRLVIEYALLGGVILILILFTSEWGIAGNILNI